MKSKAANVKINPNFKVLFQAKVSFLVRSLGLLLIMSAASLILLSTFARLYSHTTLGLFVGLISSLFLLGSLSGILYMLELCLSSGAILSLDKRGLMDFASFYHYGQVKIQDIKYIRVVDTLIGEILVIDLKYPLSPQNMSAFDRWMYFWLKRFGKNKLFILLEVIDASRLNLQTQFSHFGALLRQAAEEGYYREHIEPSPLKRGTQSVSADTVDDIELSEDTKVSDLLIERSEAAIPPPIEMDPFDDGHTFVPPPVDPSASERTKLFNYIDHLKSYVRESAKDQKICDLYKEYVVNFPRWQEQGDKRLPGEVTNPFQVSTSADYEEYAFKFMGKDFHFSLRSDIGGTDKALLSMSVNGKVMVSLQVIVQIGSLDPEEIDVYRKGDWEKDLQKLSKLLKTEVFVLEEETVVGRVHDLKLDELKDNFSTDDDS